MHTKSKYDWGIQRQPIMPRERQTAKIVFGVVEIILHAML
jgi:hypothetical protein